MHGRTDSEEEDTPTPERATLNISGGANDESVSLLGVGTAEGTVEVVSVSQGAVQPLALNIVHSFKVRTPHWPPVPPRYRHIPAQPLFLFKLFYLIFFRVSVQHGGIVRKPNRVMQRTRSTRLPNTRAMFLVGPLFRQCRGSSKRSLTPCAADGSCVCP